MRPLLLLLLLMGVSLAVASERLQREANPAPALEVGERQDVQLLRQGDAGLVAKGERLDARLFAGLDAPTGGSLLFDWPGYRGPEPVEPVPEPPVVQQDAGQPPPAAYKTRGDGPEWARSLVCAEHYTWPCWEAMAVIRCESNFDPNAWNDWSLTPDPYDGVGGLFQVAVPLHSALLGGSVFDPVLNANAAHHLYVGSGYAWTHWAWQCRP